MKRIISLLIIVAPFMMVAQNINQKATDPKRNNEMLIGYCNREGFKTIQSDFDSVYKAEYSLYQPDKESVAKISKKLKKLRIKVVMGTWCGDSKDWVPKFYKVMDQVGFDYKNLRLICVDHTKKAPVAELDKLNIERVPTFIIYKKRHELGRIVEVPHDLIEKDIVNILEKR
jgi:hypothetical protein